MNGWILSAGEPAPEIKRGIAEGASNNIGLDLVNPKEVDLVIDPDATEIYLRGKPVPLPDFVVAGFVDEQDSYNLSLLQHLEILGSLCVNTAQAILNAGDKLRTHHLLAAANIPCPKTALIHGRMRAGDLLRHFKLPLVLKVPNGSRGKGVLLVKDEGELENILECWSAGNAPTDLIAQEYVEQSHGRDLRVLVIDRKPVAAMLRTGPGQSFKSNFSQGGSVAAYPLTDQLRALSQQVTDAIGLNIGGIDLFFNGEQFLVCEANSMPGFQGIEQCCDINVPVALFQSIGRQLATKTKSSFQVRSLLRRESDAKTFCARFAATNGPSVLNYFLGMCEVPEETQETVLLDILRRNAASEHGKRNRFSEVKTVDEFRSKMPLSDWNDYAAEAKRVEAGEKNVMYAGDTPYCVATSGTTGKAKFVPESEDGALAKAITGRLRTHALLREHHDLMDGYFFPLSNAPSVDVTEGGIPVGSASGLTLAAVPEGLQKRMAFPVEVLGILDQNSLDWLVMRFALVKDVRLIVGNNAARAEQLFRMALCEAQSLIESIATGELKEGLAIDDAVRAQLTENLSPMPERAEELRALLKEDRFLPKYYWPNLSVFRCWLSGSVGRFAGTIRDFLPPKCSLFDCGYGASEGKFNVPLKAEDPAGPLTLHAGFYEFQPLDGGRPLLAHELKKDTAYELIVTNYSGLYRYRMNDVVKVSGFTGKTPNIFFETKSGEVANIVGEKLSPPLINRAFDALPNDLRKQIKYFALLAGEEEGHHWLCVEPIASEELQAKRLEEEFERSLLHLSLLYKTFRDQALLGRCRVIKMRSGWQDSLFSKKAAPRRSSGQIKLPVVMREEIDEAFVAERPDSHAHA